MSTELSDPLPIRPWAGPLEGRIRLPGSKSLTNRALVLAALSPGTTVLEGALFSRDSRLMVEALRQLGFSVLEEESACRIEVKGEGGRIPSAEAEIFVGNAGTAARFLTALVCLHPKGRYRFDGDVEMRRRPMVGLTEALTRWGARFQFEDKAGHFPFTVETAGLTGGALEVDAGASSQILTALLQVAPYAAASVQLQAPGVRPAYIEMTLGLMKQFGAFSEGSAEGAEIRLPCEGIRGISGGVYVVEPDASAASYFLALPVLVGGSIRIEGMEHIRLQGDLQFVDVLQQYFGLKKVIEGADWVISATRIERVALDLEMTTFSDTFLTLAVLSVLDPEPITIRGIGHTRFQETDRIAAMETELKKVGLAVTTGKDFISISGGGPDWELPAEAQIEIQTYADHRVAMSFGILGAMPKRGEEPWLAIVDPACCGKTFPTFFEELARLNGNPLLKS